MSTKNTLFRIIGLYRLLDIIPEKLLPTAPIVSCNVKNVSTDYINEMFNREKKTIWGKNSPVLCFIPSLNDENAMDLFNVGPNRLLIEEKKRRKMGVRQINYISLPNLREKKIDYVNSNRTTNPKKSSTFSS